jgi:lysyl-tRNA synthetase class I
MLIYSMSESNEIRILSSYLYVRSLVPEDMSREEILEKAILVRSSLQYLIALLNETCDNEPEETIQSVFFEAGKLHFQKELRWWFELLYNITMKQKEGSRFGMLCKLMSIQWVIEAIDIVLADPWLR